ncbi:MAG TPA: hypothetical protein PLS03_00575 [Terrimicrobiaceae bacterium]|nr:hypothetical protein [Terrimicrobiaceae bacterium]
MRFLPSGAENRSADTDYLDCEPTDHVVVVEFPLGPAVVEDSP